MNEDMHAGKPLISVICTCYNKGPWIRQALDSVMAQNIECPIELIIVDDASTDDSLVVIDEFRQEHPDITHVIMHDENQGIATTWLDACHAAHGDYIARIDGDDYWTDAGKLADQLSLLNDSPHARWCSTDFDIVDINGGILHAAALKSGAIATVDSYEQMLAIKGLTNSSTWLIDAELVREVNSGVDAHAADDTFSIQLELFKRTRLVRVSSSQCAMRVNWGSDSRPMSIEEATTRFEGLKKQQLEYLDAYPDIDFRKVARYLIEQDAEKDLAVFERDRRIESLLGECDEQRRIAERFRSEYDEATSLRGSVKSIARCFARLLKRR